MLAGYRPYAVDLFAGAGGMTLGFEQAGFDVVASVEIDPIHAATHEFNFPFWRVICKDIVQTSGDEIRKRAGIGSNDIDVVFGGPPCQGFSLIGKRSLDDPRNSLVFHFLRLVLELQPKIFVMENVSGLTVGKQKKFLQEIIEEFSSNGYLVKENYSVLNAVNYGVPQDRKRLFLIGCRQEFTLPSYPKPITKQSNHNGKNVELFENLIEGPSVWDAIGDLPTIEKYDDLLERDWIDAEFGVPSHFAKMLRGEIIDPKNFSYERVNKKNRLTSSLRTTHTKKSIERFRSTPQGDNEPISRFRKLDPDGICTTLRAGTASNRGAFTSPRPIHPVAPRCITVREAARLHSYPDWFRFHVTKWHGFRQVGNSVPPLLVKFLASEILNSLNVVPKKVRGKRELGDEKLLKFTMGQAAEYYGVDPRVIEPRKRLV